MAMITSLFLEFLMEAVDVFLMSQHIISIHEIIAIALTTPIYEANSFSHGKRYHNAVSI